MWLGTGTGRHLEAEARPHGALEVTIRLLASALHHTGSHGRASRGCKKGLCAELTVEGQWTTAALQVAPQADGSLLRHGFDFRLPLRGVCVCVCVF